MNLFKKAIVFPILAYLVINHLLAEINWIVTDSQLIQFLIYRVMVYVPIIFLLKWFELSWIELLISLLIIYFFRQFMNSPPVAIAIVLAKTHWNAFHNNPQ